jgi:hypothetical protein
VDGAQHAARIDRVVHNVEGGQGELDQCPAAAAADVRDTRAVLEFSQNIRTPRTPN